MISDMHRMVDVEIYILSYDDHDNAVDHDNVVDMIMLLI